MFLKVLVLQQKRVKIARFLGASKRKSVCLLRGKESRGLRNDIRRLLSMVYINPDYFGSLVPELPHNGASKNYARNLGKIGYIIPCYSLCLTSKE
jgi:hypothetical protein